MELALDDALHLLVVVRVDERLAGLLSVEASRDGLLGRRGAGRDEVREERVVARGRDRGEAGLAEGRLCLLVVLCRRSTVSARTREWRRRGSPNPMVGRRGLVKGGASESWRWSSEVK